MTPWPAPDGLGLRRTRKAVILVDTPDWDIDTWTDRLHNTPQPVRLIASRQQIRLVPETPKS